MNTLTGYDVEKLFTSIREKLDEVHARWTENKKVDKQVLDLNFLTLDLTEALEVDLEKEMQKAHEILEYVHTRMLEDLEAGKTE